MRIGLRLLVATSLVVLLSGCAILGHKHDVPDPGTHISPVLYRAQLNRWCRRTLAPRLRNVGVTLDRATAEHSLPAVVAGLRSASQLFAFYQAHFLATPVPAAMKARMAPILDEMANAEPTFQSAAAAAHAHDLQALVIEIKAALRLFVRSAKKLDAVGLSECGSGLP